MNFDERNGKNERNRRNVCLQSLLPQLPPFPSFPSFPSFPLSPQLPLSSLSLPIGNSRSCHFLSYAAFLKKRFFLSFYKFSEQHVGLVNQYDSNVGNGLSRACRYALHVERSVAMSSAHITSLYCARVCGCPLRQMINAQIILIVEQKLLEACTCNVCQFYFRFFGRGGSGTTFGNVLFAAACGLYHLVDSTVFPVKKCLCEIVGDIVDAGRFLECDKLAEVAALWEKGCWHR